MFFWEKRAELGRKRATISALATLVNSQERHPAAADSAAAAAAAAASVEGVVLFASPASGLA